MSGNSTPDADGVGLGPVLDFELFDKLPPELRHALAEAKEDYSIFQVYNAWERNLHTIEYMVQAIRGEL